MDQHGKPALVRPAVARAKLHELLVSLPPCTVAMEACTGAHHWARLFSAAGHTVRLIAPKFVAPYRRSGVRGKNDAADAAAICEAAQRPSMRFVPPKSIDQQTRLMVHRARQGYVEARTACINRLRGLMSELGVVLPLKRAAARLVFDLRASARIEIQYHHHHEDDAALRFRAMVRTDKLQPVIRAASMLRTLMKDARGGPNR